MQGYPLYELREKMLRKVHDFCEYLTDWDTKREYYINELLPDYIYPYPKAWKKLPKEAKDIFLEIQDYATGKELNHLLDIIVGVKENYEKIKKQKEQKEQEQKLAFFKKLEESFDFQGFIHSTDFENFIKIMQDNKIFCRKYLEENNLLFDDIALKDVINNTSGLIKNYVRFYWRTKTPTNYKNEGIKPKSTLIDNNKAHSPNPVIFIFDYKIALNSNVRFTDRNAGTFVHSFDCWPNHNYNFRYIFHNSSLLGYEETERKSIIQSNCAEFLYPHEISLDYVKKIIFRNQADYNRAVLRFGNDNRFCIDENQFINHWLKVKTYELKIQNNMIYLKINFNFGKELIRFNLNDFNHKICLLNKFEKEVKRIDIINQYNNEINCKIANNIEYSELCYYIDDIECIRVKLND